MASPLGYEVERRVPILSGSPQMTPGEVNQRREVDHHGNVSVPTRHPDSLVPTRPARRTVAFFLQPTGIDGSWGDWWAAAFVQGKEIVENRRDYPRGMFMNDDQRRNIDVPPTESYGDYVGASDGVAPYGLE